MAPARKAAAKAESAESVGPMGVGATYTGLVPNPVNDQGDDLAVGCKRGALTNANDNGTGVYVNTPAPSPVNDSGNGTAVGVRAGALNHPHDS